MTKKRKLEILGKVLEKLETRKTFRNGLCKLVDHEIHGSERAKHEPYWSMRFLKIYKPKTVGSSSFWFPRNASGNLSRIKLVKLAIKKVKEGIRK